MEETKPTNPSGLRSKKVRISRATLDDVKKIVELINEEHMRSGALLRVCEEDVAEWIRLNLSFVARMDGRIVGHSAATLWPQSGWYELRGQVVQPAHRGEGIYNHMTRRQIREIFKESRGRTIVSMKYTMKGASLLETLGFKLMGYGTSDELVKQGIPAEFFHIGPQNRPLRAWTLVWENYASAARLKASAKAPRAAKAPEHRKPVE
jgi:N-acetylglutamate synthase-like GNAT family acetyltransferase